MRLWSLHPSYLDAKGLVALWREGLLARAVLRGETRGYLRHPQLERFRAADDPRRAIDAYLGAVCDEAGRRGYAFHRGKIGDGSGAVPLIVTRGQLDHEWRHLLAKLAVRDRDRHARAATVARVRSHPLFRVHPGPVADWERIAPSP